MDRSEARKALLQAAEDLLEGRVEGPLTGLRLIEVAGVKRHRLTHDNSDINESFQMRARQINRTKPEVERLQAERTKLREKLRAERKAHSAAKNLLQAYAMAIVELSAERDQLRSALNESRKIVEIRPQ